MQTMYRSYYIKLTRNRYTWTVEIWPRDPELPILPRHGFCHFGEKDGAVAAARSQIDELLKRAAL
jgi:hypothetical protein